mgnify:CR=1 FL=1
MNDIDASKEDIAYDTLNDAACGSLLKGGVINGNSHTIYNLKGTLIERNLGTIKNLNVSVINTDKDNDVLGTDSGICGIAYYNSYGDDTGLIENCNVSMTVRRSFDKLNIGFITCGIAIVELAVNMAVTGLGCTGRSSYNANVDDMQKALELAKEDAADNDVPFYRVEDTGRLTKNDDTRYGYASGTQFSSLMNINVSHFYQALYMEGGKNFYCYNGCLLYTSPSPRD